MKRYYVDTELMPMLLENGCPIRLIRVRDEKYPIWYTLPHDDPDWQYCDAYYVPTQAEVIDWLSEEKKIDIEISRYLQEVRFGYKVINNNEENLKSHYSAPIYETREAARNDAIKYAFVNYIN